MPKKYIVVPVDGATNIKLEILDFDTLETVYSKTANTPVRTFEELNYNESEEEFKWFDSIIKGMPAELKNAAVFAPVSRGASGGLIGSDNSLCEVPGKGLTLAYTQRYPENVEEYFKNLAGDADKFYRETGSVRDLPGSLTLVKRFLYEELERPQILKRSAAFATYGILMSGYFLGDYLKVGKEAGNEHSYWMCHAGARNINKKAGALSSLAEKIKSFKNLVPEKPSVCYKLIDKMPESRIRELCVSGNCYVIPGGHDTCLSHIPIMSTFYQAFPSLTGKPVIQVDAGTWTMSARIGGSPDLPEYGYKKDIIVQGTVDGEPVVTGKYGGGNDFKYVKKMVEEKGHEFKSVFNPEMLKEVLINRDVFILPNINPDNFGTGPFPEIKGRIINEQKFFSNYKAAPVFANLTAAITTSHQLESVSKDKNIPLVVTAGASKDVYFTKMLASITGRKTYTLLDKNGNAVTETTTLGAATAGKAACLNIHPYEVDVNKLGVSYVPVEPFDKEITALLNRYKSSFLETVKKENR